MKEREVVVVGGGPAGIAAALAAARNGADTLLIERYGFIGGNMTAGLVCQFDPIDVTCITGIATEIRELLRQKKACLEYLEKRFEMPYSYSEGGCSFDPEVLKHEVTSLLKNAGVKFLLHSWATDVIMDGSRIKGVVVCNKSGQERILGHTVIDCSGDGDIAVRAGAEYKIGDEKGHCMAPTLIFRVGGVRTERIMKYFDNNPQDFGYHPRLGRYMRNPRKSLILRTFRSCIEKAREKGDLTIQLPEHGVGIIRLPREGEFYVNTTESQAVDGTKVKDLTRAELSQRESIPKLFAFMKKYIPGFENAYILDVATQIGIRETRRIKGDYAMTVEDLEKSRSFEDAVMQAKWAHTDVHSGKDLQWSFRLIEGPYQIPYRCLLPKAVENLLVAGRCLSSTREAMASLRIMTICMVLGQAAGTAAAISVKSKREPRDIDVHRLQESLRTQGVNI